ncbi:glycosyltransferase [Chryseobacterium aquaticum]|uniref:Glycosyl transferase family 2 n=1 Tax=Chryseobacterium aquaticum subsp. greenlandense TaxID=345663 RepID=A0A101CKY1_9FLAO|nr:glycosyltransferase [Chryseobacterium aquaticum]KUJ57880.1 glycosyl transferase family 2 [Chryseobacterium aquaticum subsp. greenlandense]
MNPLVTVSIPIFKCEKFIKNCLLSIKDQKYTNIEVILINDQTPDNSAVISEQFIKENQLSNWSLINLKENSGLSVVRNEGILRAQGKYIFFVDSDDELYPDSIESLVKKAEETNAEIIMGEVQGIKIPSQEMVDVFPIYTKKDILDGNREIFSELVNGGFAVSSWNKLILVDFLKKHNLYFTKGLYAQDSLHTFEMGLYVQKLVFLRKKTYKYYLHQESVIHNRKKIHFDNWITIAQKINSYFLREKDLFRKKLILEYLINFKAITLEMNWKAQQNEQLWKASYHAYNELSGLSFLNYLSRDYSPKLKKQDLFYRLPLSLGYRFFRWRFDR